MRPSQSRRGREICADMTFGMGVLWGGIFWLGVVGGGGEDGAAQADQRGCGGDVVDDDGCRA